MSPRNPIHDAIDDEDIDDETGEVDPEWYPIPEGLRDVWDEAVAAFEAETGQRYEDA